MIGYEVPMSDVDTVTQTATQNNSLELLAKLLAAENISVEHNKQFSTASFDLESRTLRLPVWKKMDERLYHMLVLHEVGHALHTPMEEWTSNIKLFGSKFRGFLNIIEDARIERKMKIKFPGSRRDFFEGYKGLHQQDFFSLNGKLIADMSLINRINLHFKIGSFVEIPFTEDELIYVDQISRTTTFNETVNIAIDLFDLAKEKDAERNEDKEVGPEPEKNEYSKAKTDDDADDDFDDDAEDFDDFDDAEDDAEADSSSEMDTSTDESLKHRLSQDMLDPSAIETFYVDFDQKIDYREHTFGYREVLDCIDTERAANLKHQYQPQNIAQKYLESSTKRYNNFCNMNTKAVSYLVKEFEIKKAADQYSRSRQAKTGSIDPNKLHAYKMTDNIFRRLTVIPAAKNHGLVMFIDFSGSMAQNMKGTVEQLLNLVMFCRKVNIPHRVYAFQDIHPGYMKRKLLPDHTKQIPDNSNLRVESVYLLELFHEKMRTNEFKQMSMSLLDFASWFGYRSNRRSSSSSQVDNYGMTFYPRNTFQLNGTPLNASIMLSRKLISDFRAQTNVQVVNAIFLTDGESRRMGCARSLNAKSTIRRTIMRDKLTGYELEEIAFRDHHECQKDNNNHTQTAFLINCIKKSEKVRAVCFRISSKREITSLIVYLKDFELHQASMRSNKFVGLHDFCGFEQYFLIPDGKDLNVETSEMQGVTTGDSKSKLARAFLKANTNRSVNRVLLSRFVTSIAA